MPMLKKEIVYTKHKLVLYIFSVFIACILYCCVSSMLLQMYSIYNVVLDVSRNVYSIPFIEKYLEVQFVFLVIFLTYLSYHEVVFPLSFLSILHIRNILVENVTEIRNNPNKI